jgi:hypothetical protein
MKVEIDACTLDGLVRAWLRDTCETITINSQSNYVHPEDAKDYRKDLKAIRRLLNYIGEG